VFLCCSLAAFADPPARVGRLNYLSGSVSFRPGDLDDWSPAALNVPLKTGDHLWTDVNSRAELHVGSTAIRLEAETAFAFLNTDDHVTQIRLTQGLLNVRLRTLAESDIFEVDTPNAAVSLLRPGLYRIQVDSIGNTTVTDRLGESEVTAAGSAFSVHPGETAAISGTDMPTYDIQAALPEDSWDQWCAGRDRREEQAMSARYVSREMVGYEDLDEYGVWRPVPEYGVVWVPSNVPPGWAPYRFGHWMWVEPWGWTWVDDTPWGFAPFHYGRWAFVGGGWAWIPGRMVARPVYAPALVAFVGGNSWHVSLSVGSGGVAWFPLGPREVYVPSYRVSDTYVRNVNVTHVNVTNINVTNVNVVNTTYVNRTVPGAVTAVPQQAFVRAQPVAKAAVAVPPQAVASAPISGTTALVTPQRESLSAKPAAFAVAHPPAQAMTRTVVARSTPPPPPVPFAARQAALAANPGQPVDPARLATLRQNTAATPQLTRSAIEPAAAPGSNGAKPAMLRPARQGLQAPQPASAVPAGVPAPATSTSVAPAQLAPRDRPERSTVPAASTPQNPERGRGPQTENSTDRNDRPGNAAVRPPATQVEPKPQPKVETKPVVTPPHPPQPHQEQPHPARAPKPETGRGTHPEPPKNSAEPKKAKPEHEKAPEKPKRERDEQKKPD
jgi:hypothetical protein